jgi:DNA-binding transcriptional regulator YbjK
VRPDICDLTYAAVLFSLPISQLSQLDTAVALLKHFADTHQTQSQSVLQLSSSTMQQLLQDTYQHGDTANSSAVSCTPIRDTAYSKQLNNNVSLQKNMR